MSGYLLLRVFLIDQVAYRITNLFLLIIQYIEVKYEFRKDCVLSIIYQNCNVYYLTALKEGEEIPLNIHVSIL